MAASNRPQQGHYQLIDRRDRCYLSLLLFNHTSDFVDDNLYLTVLKIFRCD